jgi:hypothetical protein
MKKVSRIQRAGSGSLPSSSIIQSAGGMRQRYSTRGWGVCILRKSR